MPRYDASRRVGLELPWHPVEDRVQKAKYLKAGFLVVANPP